MSHNDPIELPSFDSNVRERSNIQNFGGQAWTPGEMGSYLQSQRTTGGANQEQDLNSLLNNYNFYGNRTNDQLTSNRQTETQTQTESHSVYENAISQNGLQHFRRGEVRANNALSLLQEAANDIQSGDISEAKGNLRRALKQLYRSRVNFKEGAEETGDTQRYGERVTDVGEGRQELRASAKDIVDALRELKRGDERESLARLTDAFQGIRGGVGKIRNGVGNGLVDLDGPGGGDEDFGDIDDSV